VIVALLVAASPAGARKPGARRGKAVGKLVDGAQPGALAVGGDGTVWYSGLHTRYYGGEYEEGNEGSFIGYLTPGGKPTETTLHPGTYAGQPVVGPAGEVWFPESHKDAQGNVSLEIVAYSTAGKTQSSGVGSGVTEIDAMAAMGGDLWFSGLANIEGGERGVIGKIELGAAGALTVFPLEPGCGAGKAFTATADSIWFGESCPPPPITSNQPPERSNLGQMNSTGAITRHPLPAADQPIAVAPGPDASVWVGMRNIDYRKPSSLVRLQAGGNLVERRVRYASFGGMTVGPEGRLWFASMVRGPYYNALASIGPGGRKSRPICVSGKHYCEGEISELTVGPEGSLWYAAGPAASHGSGGGGGSGLMEYESLQRAAGFIGRVR
jgi:streptogramin lyase